MQQLINIKENPKAFYAHAKSDSSIKSSIAMLVDQNGDRSEW